MVTIGSGGLHCREITVDGRCGSGSWPQKIWDEVIHSDLQPSLAKNGIGMELHH